MRGTKGEGGPKLSELELEILLALGEGPRHGYGIITDVEARSSGRVTVRSGTLYATLRGLRDGGLVESSPAPADEVGDDKRRKYYRLTAKGRGVAAAEVARMRSLVTVAERRGLAPEAEEAG